MARDISQKVLAKLQVAVRGSYGDLRSFREHRTEAIRNYVGTLYSDNGPEKSRTVNFSELFINTYSHQLAAKTPRATVTAVSRKLTALAANFEFVLNDIIKNKINLAQTFRRAVFDALFSIGIVKVGKVPAGQVEVGGMLHTVGQPFAETVSLDDWFHDTSARVWEDIRYAGNRYLVGVEDAKESELYKVDMIERFQDHQSRDTNQTGEEKAASLTSSTTAEPEKFVETVELADIWLPDEDIIITVPADAEDGENPWRVVEFEGPKHGMYHLLRYNEVPDNIMPLAPIALLRGLDNLANNVFRKLDRQARRQKNVGLVRPGGEKDAERILNAGDGDFIKSDDPQNAQLMKFPGVEPGLVAFFLQIKNIFAYFGGNLDTLGGLGPQAETATQDVLLEKNASKRMEDMQEKTHLFDKDVIEDIGYYVWTDPLREYPVERQIPGTDITLTSTLRPDERAEEFFQLAVDIEPYSMTAQTPSAQLNAIVGFVQNIALPLALQMQEQGISINVEGLLRRAAKLTHIKGLEDIVTFTSTLPEEAGAQARPSDPTRPGVTKHVSERVNRPGATRAGNDGALTQALLTNGGIQDSELAGIGRSTG